jgi:predicted TPR repeat methyltransferase
MSDSDSSGYYSVKRDLTKTLERAVAHHQAGRLAEAIYCYQVVLRQGPSCSEALHLLGVAEAQAGNGRKAIGLIEQSLALNPNVPEAHNNLGNALFILGDVGRAVDSFRQALNLNPNYSEAYNNLGNALQADRKLDEAIRSYLSAIKLNPDYVDACSNLAMALQANGKLEKSIEMYQRALELAPRSADLRFKYGVALRSVGKLAEALVSLRQATELQNDHAEAFYELGIAHKAAGKIDEAIDCLHRAVELSPENGSACHALSALTGVTTRTAPVEYIRDLFDSYSSTFEEHLLKGLKYCVPKRFRDLLLIALHRPTRFRSALDIGCGTGLVGDELRELTERMTGIDVSERMAEIARTKATYARVVVGEAVRFLADTAERFDLFTAGDVLIYVGAIEELVAFVRQRACDLAYFVFSTEEKNGDSYELRPSGRYAHSEAYIRRVAVENGFVVESCTREELRKEKEGWVFGQIFVLNCTGKD